MATLLLLRWSTQRSNKKPRLPKSLPIKEVVGNKSILIVDDDQMSVQLVRAVLSGEGYDLRAALNADEALNDGY
jgi:PleD family two-component response regulator